MRKKQELSVHDILSALEEKLKNNESEKYKNRIHKLNKLALKEDKDTKIWVYLKSYKDDLILTGKYIFNYGIMTPMMKEAVGKVLDYGSYTQEIVEMNFSDFEKIYNKQQVEIDMLILKYPGIHSGTSI